MTWLWCPRQYYYQYIEKLKFVPNMAMKMGTYFHDFAEDFFKAFDYSELNELHTQKEFYTNLTYVKERIKFPKIIDKYVDNFVRFEGNRMARLRAKHLSLYDHHKPIFLEDRFTSEPIWKDLVVYGIIDRGDPMPFRNGMALIEYKLSQKINHDSVVKQDAFYKLVLDNCPDTNFPTVTDFVGYSAINNAVIHEEFTQKREDWVMKKLKEMYNDIKSGTFQRNSTMFCENCNGIELCDSPSINDEVLLGLLTDCEYRAIDLGRLMDVPQWKVEESLDFLVHVGKLTNCKKGRSTYYRCTEE